MTSVGILLPNPMVSRYLYKRNRDWRSQYGNQHSLKGSCSRGCTGRCCACVLVAGDRHPLVTRSAVPTIANFSIKEFRHGAVKRCVAVPDVFASGFPSKHISPY